MAHPSPDAIAAAVQVAYDKLPRKGKPQPNEWTMLAGVVVAGRPAEPPVAVAVATGNKCIGQRDMSFHGDVVNDCHAEVLARRAFKRYLLQEVQAHRARCCSGSGSAASGEGLPASALSCDLGLLTHDQACKTFVLREGLRLYLYISDSPCGDATVYADVVAIGARGERGTGAKPLGWTPDQESAVASASSEALYQGCGEARTKSGRSDLPQEQRTLSMCCSDKVARWVGCGIGGGLGAAVGVEAIHLSGVVLGADPVYLAGAVAQYRVPPGGTPWLLLGEGKVEDEQKLAEQSSMQPQLLGARRALWDRLPPSSIASRPPLALALASRLPDVAKSVVAAKLAASTAGAPTTAAAVTAAADSVPPVPGTKRPREVAAPLFEPSPAGSAVWGTLNGAALSGATIGIPLHKPIYACSSGSSAPVACLLPRPPGGLLSEALLAGAGILFGAAKRRPPPPGTAPPPNPPAVVSLLSKRRLAEVALAAGCSCGARGVVRVTASSSSVGSPAEATEGAGAAAAAPSVIVAAEVRYSLCPCWQAKLSSPSSGSASYGCLKASGSSYRAAKAVFHGVLAGKDAIAGSGEERKNPFAAWGGAPAAYEEGLLLPTA